MNSTQYHKIAMHVACVIWNHFPKFGHTSKYSHVLVVTESCPRLRAPRNGDVTITNDQQLAVFSCDRFYTMRGSHVLKCKKGKWNASPPTCHSISKFCRRKCDF